MITMPLLGTDFTPKMELPRDRLVENQDMPIGKNSADYKIDIRLNEDKKHFTGSEVITYTNNSPDALGFLWVQVDQNLFKKDSRGNAIIPLEAEMELKGKILMAVMTSEMYMYFMMLIESRDVKMLVVSQL